MLIYVLNAQVDTTANEYKEQSGDQVEKCHEKEGKRFALMLMSIASLQDKELDEIHDDTARYCDVKDDPHQFHYALILRDVVSGLLGEEERNLLENERNHQSLGCQNDKIVAGVLEIECITKDQ